MLGGLIIINFKDSIIKINNNFYFKTYSQLSYLLKNNCAVYRNNFNKKFKYIKI